MDKIRKSKRKSNFTTVNNDYLQDVKISWKAKGLITYIMSLPPDWELNLSDLKNRSKDGRDATNNGIKELIEHGYARRVRKRGNDGTFSSYDYEVSDLKEYEPQTENPFMDKPQTENPHTDNPDTEKPHTDNPTQVNTNLSNKTKEINTKGSNYDANPNSLFPDAEPKKESRETKTLFRNSKYAELEVFLKKFDTPEFAPIDLVFYYHSVSDWSDSSNTKRTANGWLATARTFVRKDMEKNKVRYKPEHKPESQKVNVAGAMEFLNEDY